jgi:hypothetical protein
VSSEQSFDLDLSLGERNNIVPVKDVPEAPRVLDRDEALFRRAKSILENRPGEWFQVKIYDRPTAAQQKANRINTGNSTMFPTTEYEARYSKHNKGSVLFMRRRNV